MTAASVRRWRYPWQVVRVFPNGALIVCCSHRWEVTAGWCADLRDAWRWLTRRAQDCPHDVRRTPQVTESGGIPHQRSGNVNGLGGCTCTCGAQWLDILGGCMAPASHDADTQ